MNATETRIYRRNRAEGWTAQGALRAARTLSALADDWNESEGRDGSRVFAHESGAWRLRIVPDSEPYDPGDLFNPDVCGDIPGGLRALKAQEKAFWRRLEREGVWGYVVERACPTCGAWEHVDSCWGFDGFDFCKLEGADAAFHAMRERAA